MDFNAEAAVVCGGALSQDVVVELGDGGGFSVQGLGVGGGGGV